MVVVTSRMGLVTAAPQTLRPRRTSRQGASLLPKVRDQFAEFLNQGSLVHLSLLNQPTGVGLRYGQSAAPQGAFRACSGLGDLRPPLREPLVLASQRWPAYQLERPSSGRSPSPPASPCFSTTDWCRNHYRLSIAYALRPRLRPDSPTADHPGSGTLRLAVVGVRTPRYVTHPDIRTR